MAASKKKWIRNIICLVTLAMTLVCASGQVASAQVPRAEGPYGGCTASNRVLFLTEPRMTGYEVEELQERLAELGYYSGKIDGVFGPKTDAAVKKLQSDVDVEVDGRVGPATWEGLSRGIQVPSISTADEGGPGGEVSIVIDTNKRTLTVMDGGKLFKTFPCAVGKSSTPTPVGEWLIAHKGANWGGGFGVRWMGLNVPWGVFGIHGTNKPYSVGNFASHGCIRMFNQHVRIVYSWAKEGTPVTIIGKPAMPPTAPFRKVLKRGAIGPDIVQIQLRLKKFGYLMGRADGRFGPALVLAVKAFQVRNGLPETGIVDINTYRALGFIIRSERVVGPPEN